MNNTKTLMNNNNNRISSIDVLRGIIMILMTIVNFCGGIKGIPETLKHASGNLDTFTLADSVVPGFLFVVGLSIPYAFFKRIEEKGNLLKVIFHIIIRTSSLLFLGVWWVNRGTFSEKFTGMSVELWYILGYVAVFLIWIDFSKMKNVFIQKSNIYCKIIGWLLLAYLMIIYRGINYRGDVIWLRTSWWGILGSIGWAYLFSSITYILCKGKTNKLLIMIGFTIALYMGIQHGALPMIKDFSFMNISVNWGTKSAIVLCGCVVSSIIFDRENILSKEKLSFLILFSIMLIVIGFILRPIHTFSKSLATESYSLVNAGAWSLLYLILYIILDYYKKGLSFIKPLVFIGKNPLFLYFIPNLFKTIVAYTGISNIIFPYLNNGGVLAMLNILLVSVILFFITIVATKNKIILKL